MTDTEIKIGQTMPYSEPASAYSNYGKLETAYFQMINDGGGINGRKVSLMSLDDGYSPPKTVEQTRKLIEDGRVYSSRLPTVTHAANSLSRVNLGPRIGLRTTRFTTANLGR